jgi:uncharacterized protein YegP (UPF0339 family)
MNPNPDNDRVEVYRDAAGEYRWRRVDGDNGRIVSVSSEGYANGSYAMLAARSYNQRKGDPLPVTLVEP